MMNTQVKTDARPLSFMGFVTNFSESVESYRLYRQTVKELSNLSDRELADLNISRWDIERIAREAVAAR